MSNYGVKSEVTREPNDPVMTQEILDRLKTPVDPTTVDVVTQITTERGGRYGPFINNAVVSQRIKLAMREEPAHWDKLPEDVQEMLDNLALKISRIVTGDPLYLDNYDDIAGYAKIVARRIRESTKDTDK